MPKIDIKSLNELLTKIDYQRRFYDNYKLMTEDEKQKMDEEKQKKEKQQNNNETKIETENVEQKADEANNAMAGGSFKGFDNFDFGKYIKPNSSDYQNKFDEYVKNIDDINDRYKLLLLNLLNNIIDFHKWYDDTSVYFSTEEIGPSKSLDSWNIPNDGFNFEENMYGGSNAFYKSIFSLIFDIMFNEIKKGDDDDINKQKAIYIMYCLGKNVNYWLAKRYLMIAIGNIRPNNLEDSLYSLVKEENIEVISSKKYNEIIYKKDIGTEQNVCLLYHYDMFKNEAKNTNDKMEPLNGKLTDTYKKIMYLVFEKVKNTFKQDKKETKYEEPKNKLEFGTPIPINVKTTSNIQDKQSLLRNQQQNKFFAVETLKQIGTKYPAVFSGGKMFCGGAETLCNSKELYKSIFNNILKKIEEKKQNFNDADKKKIISLIEQLGKYEDAIYEILANMNKYITSDLAHKHDSVNYDMMANAVKQFEKIMVKYNHKNFVLFKDLVKLNNAVQQLRIDTITGKF